MKFTRSRFWFVVMSIISISLFSRAEASPISQLKWSLHHHGRLTGEFCPYLGCCCFVTLAPGPATPDDIAAGYGNIGGEILNVGGGKQLHIIFYSQPTFAPDSAWVNVDIPWNVPLGVAHVLGYESVQLLPGVYPYSPGTSTYGDLYISATVGAAVPELSTWGILSSALVLLAVGGLFLKRRLDHSPEVPTLS